MKFLAIATICLAAPLALAQMLETSGCYSNPGSLRTQGSYPYQSLGYCQELCMKGARKYMALHDNDQCWCGDSLPEQEDLVSDDKCDTPCTGWPETMCKSIHR
jgi:cell wall integrity and stress response component